jgi:carbon storage regulator
MLVLSRKPGEKVVIGGGITVTVGEVKGNRVKVCIEAPEQLRVLRGEVCWWFEHPGSQKVPPGEKLADDIPRRKPAGRPRMPR